jgi:hypothetical protein
MRSRHAITTAHLSVLAMGLCISMRPAFAQPSRPDSKPIPANGSANAESRAKATESQPKPLAQSLSGLALAEYEGGKLLFMNKDFSNALIKFQHAHELSRDPRLLWNVAVCQKELRRYTRMLATLRQLLDEGGPLLSNQDREDAAKAAKAVEAFVSPLKLSVNEPGATLSIDGETVGTTPLKEPLLVDVGSHEIRLSKPGFKDAVKSLVVAGAGDVEVTMTLEKEIHRGRLVIVAGANDLIQLDGKAMGQARWEGAVPSGGHTLRVTAPGMDAYQAEVLVKDNEVRRIQVTLNSHAGSEVTRWLWIAGGTLLLAGAVVGGIVLFQPTQETVSGTIDPPGTIQLSFGGRK